MTKLKRMFKQITAFSLAVLLTVVAFPYDSVVYAGPDDYPPEILFPINVYDFPADNLLFEYIADWQYGTSAVSEAGVYFNLVDGPGNNGGKGLLENELGPDGLPVYKRETVERIASYVQGALKINVGAPVLDQPILANGEKNYLSMRNYILSDEWTRIEAEAGTLINEAPDPANAIRVGNNATCSGGQYVGYIGGTNFNNSVEFTYDNSMLGIHRLRLYYMSGDAARGFTVTVNGRQYPVNNLNSGGWNTVGMVEVDVFMDLGQNTINVTGNGNWAPDFDYIEIDNGFMFEAEDPTIATFTGNVDRVYGNAYSGGSYMKMYDGVWQNRGTTAAYTFESTVEGNYTLQIDYVPSRQWRRMNVMVNGTTTTISEHNDGRWEDTQMHNGPITIPIQLRIGTNTVTFEHNGDGAVIDLDRLRIYKGGYPLGDYDASKTKFTEDMDPNVDGVQNTRGWTDITTCMDYAYFVTSNLFKYNASLNVQHDDYKQLVFHRVDDDESETPSFEFMADKNHANTKLIYNATNKTVRNVMPNDPGTKEGDVVRNGGSLFLVDDAVRNYPEVDGLKAGGSDNTDHNFGYTVASKSKFVYKKGYNQYFYFSGDDDVYVFINGKLLVDLGGSHEQLDGEFNLDEMAEEDMKDGVNDYGLEDGKVVDLSFFYMERHTVESNFYAKLNFELATDELKHAFDFQTIPYGYLADLNYKFTSMRELNTNKNFTFKDNFGNIIGAEGFQLGEGVSLKDNTLTVVVTKEDGTIDQDRSASFTFYIPEQPTKAELDAIMNYFKNLEITLGESFEISGAQYDTATIPYDDYADTAEEGVNSKSCSFTPTVTYDAWMDGATIPTQNTLTANNPVKIVVGSIKITTSPDADNLKKELVDYGAFELVRTDTKGNQSVLYTNPTYYDGSSVKVVDKLPQDYYTLELDTSVLTGYKVTIKGSSTPVITDAYGNRTEGDTTVYESGDDTRLTILFQPVYDPDTKIWSYPEVIFELKATRDLPDLKDLT